MERNNGVIGTLCNACLITVMGRDDSHTDEPRSCRHLHMTIVACRFDIVGPPAIRATRLMQYDGVYVSLALALSRRWESALHPSLMLNPVVRLKAGSFQLADVLSNCMYSDVDSLPRLDRICSPKHDFHIGIHGTVLLSPLRTE